MKSEFLDVQISEEAILTGGILFKPDVLKPGAVWRKPDFLKELFKDRWFPRPPVVPFPRPPFPRPGCW